jgi:hypothetical protein
MEKAKRDRRQAPSGRSASITSSNKPGSTLDAALDYLRRGWSVVPVRAVGKQPLVSWLDYQKKRATPDEVRAWFEKWPSANVGIVTGQISNLVVLDIDRAHGGEESLAELESRHGPMPATVTALSGGGGRHFYFAAPADPTPLRSRVGIALGIDVRAEGGMIVAPPSHHSSGGRYRWITAPDDAETLSGLPRWLINWIRNPQSHRGHGTQHWRRIAQEGVQEGVRNSTIASFTGHLLWCGVDIEVIKELMLCWNRVRATPPLDDAEVLRTVDSIHRTHERGHEET